MDIKKYISEKLNVRCKKHMKGILRLRYISICSKEIRHVRERKQSGETSEVKDMEI